jgi:2-amino-4-hydroxy-6-hydroxymethyldihydropteridine diphosphokinase
MADVYVGFGSNVEPERHLRQALADLSRYFGPLRCSSVYRSPAYGFSGDDFLNLVATFCSDAGPAAVEALLSSTEYAGGRARGPERFAPRTLDLDLLLYGQCVDAAGRLPREDVLAYPFVLAPLAEIVPQLRHPLTGVALGEAWRSMEAAAGHSLRRLGSLSCLD